MFEDGAARFASLPEPIFRSMGDGNVMRRQYSRSYQDSQDDVPVEDARAAIVGDIRQYFEYLARLFNSLR
jgi:hypothetical protein